MSAALKTALREACAELRQHNDRKYWTPTPIIEAWERLADEAELLELAQEPRIEQTDEALATMLGVPVEMVAPAGGRDTAPEQPTPEQPGPPPSHRCPEHGDLCRGPACCCADLHEPEQPIGDRDIKPVNVASDPMPKWEYTETWDAWLARLDAWKQRQPAPAPQPGLDRLQASHMMPTHLPGAASVPDEECARCGTVGPVDVPCRGCRVAPRPGDESPPRPCCIRLGSVWCTEPDGHAGECKGPEERVLPHNDHGPRRKR